MIQQIFLDFPLKITWINLISGAINFSSIHAIAFSSFFLIIDRIMAILNARGRVYVQNLSILVISSVYIGYFASIFISMLNVNEAGEYLNE